MSAKLPSIIQQNQTVLTPAEYQKLADVPPELEWFANIDNPKTRRAYKIDLEDFTGFAGIRAAKFKAYFPFLFLPFPNCISNIDK